MITTKKVVEACKNLCDKKITQEEFDAIIKKIEFRKRLNIFKKSMIVSMAMADLDEISFSSGSEFDSAIDFERIYVIRFILSYMETGEEFYLIQDEDIENMYDAGLIDHILSICERDFNVIKRMFDNAIKFKYLNMIGSFISDISAGENKETLEKISEIFKDPKLITDVSNIMQYNDPALKTIKDEIFKPLEKE